MMTPPQIHVLVQGVTATICIRGRATFMLGTGLRDFILQSEAGGARQFLIGLDECEYMDSTILGVLALLAAGHREGRWRVELLNTPPRILGQLAEMGLRRFFRYAVRPLPPVETAMTALQPSFSSARLVETVREAHTTLGRVDPANAARFACVLEVLGGTPDGGCARNPAPCGPHSPDPARAS